MSNSLVEKELSKSISTETLEKLTQFNSSKYTVEQMVDCAAYYLVNGNMMRTAKTLGIPYDTVVRWHNTDWWKAVIADLRKVHQEELDIKLTKVINKAVEELEDRVENGDYSVSRSGEVRRVPMKAQTLAVAALAIPFDKRESLRRGIIEEKETVNQERSLHNIAEKLASMAESLLAKQLETPVKKNQVENVEYEVIDAKQA